MNTFADANAAKAALDRARSLVTESAPDPSLVDRIQRVDVTVDDGEDGWGISGADRARHAARSVSLFFIRVWAIGLSNSCFVYRLGRLGWRWLARALTWRWLTAGACTPR